MQQTRAQYGTFFRNPIEFFNGVRARMLACANRRSNGAGETMEPLTDRAMQYLARAKSAEEWGAKTADPLLRQGWIKIAEEHQLLAKSLSK